MPVELEAVPRVCRGADVEVCMMAGGRSGRVAVAEDTDLGASISLWGVTGWPSILRLCDFGLETDLGGADVRGRIGVTIGACRKGPDLAYDPSLLILISSEDFELHDVASERMVVGPQPEDGPIRADQFGEYDEWRDASEVPEVSKSVRGTRSLPQRVHCEMSVQSFAGTAEVDEVFDGSEVEQCMNYVEGKRQHMERYALANHQEQEELGSTDERRS